MAMFKRFYAILILCLSSTVLISCNPEAFLSRSEGVSNTGKVGSETRLKSASLGLERYALAARDVVVSGNSSDISFAAGSIALADIESASSSNFSGALEGDLSSVYCDVDGLHVSWVDSRDSGDQFFYERSGPEFW